MTSPQGPGGIEGNTGRRNSRTRLRVFLPPKTKHPNAQEWGRRKDVKVFGCSDDYATCRSAYCRAFCISPFLNFRRLSFVRWRKSHGDANNWILTGALRPADVGKPQSSQALFPWQFSSPPARLRHQASLQPRRQRALRLIGYIEKNIVHLIKCNE